MTHWSRSPERGAAGLVRLMLWLMRHAGWFAGGVALPGITAWFFAFSPAARAASREYLGRALGHPATAADVLRHVHSFACAILDRALLLTGQADSFAIDVAGLEHIDAALAGGRGCVLLGAHLGSFAVLRRLAERCPAPVRLLMHRGNAGAFTRIMDSLDPALAAAVIPIGDISAMLRVHEAVAAGALVGVLADRAPPGARRVAALFFGQPAAFPAGPFVLAASLGVPVVSFRAVRTGRRQYAAAFAPFAERVTLGRATREQDLAAVVARYAAWLEAGCRAHPFNWFNFFPFWERPEHAPGHARLPVAAAAGGAVPRGHAAAG